MKSKKENALNNSKLNTYIISDKGSLGLLAIGDIGLRAWRKVKKASKLKESNEEKK